MILAQRDHTATVRHLLSSISDRERDVKALEEELECVLCQERAETPIFWSQEHSLVCSSCRAGAPGGDLLLLRHRFAERIARVVAGLRQELSHLKTELDNILP